MARTRYFFSYFPQFHSDPINDLAWGDGFTDWDLIRAVPESKRDTFTPERGYYDPSASEYLETLSSQLNSLPISNPGLMVYHYHFDGVSALSGFEKQLLAQPDKGPPFFLCWANETWSKRWVGRPGEVLIEQQHQENAETIQSHALYLSQFFNLAHYHRVSGRPLFMVYDAQASSTLPQVIKMYRNAFAELGHNPLIGCCIGYSMPPTHLSPYDFGCEFQPRFFFNSRSSSGLMKAAGYLKTNFPKFFEWIGGHRDRIRKLDGRRGFAYRDYLEAIAHGRFEVKLRQIVGELPLMRSTFLSWDNTPRYGERSTHVTYEGITADSLAVLKSLKSDSELPLLINSWNEWSEGAALEPSVCNNPFRTAFLEGFDG